MSINQKMRKFGKFQGRYSREITLWDEQDYGALIEEVKKNVLL